MAAGTAEAAAGAAVVIATDEVTRWWVGDEREPDSYDNEVDGMPEVPFVDPAILASSLLVLVAVTGVGVLSWLMVRRSKDKPRA